MSLSGYVSPIESAPEGGRVLQAAMADFHVPGRGVSLLIREPAPSTTSGGVELWRGRPPPAVPPRDYGRGALERGHVESRSQ